MSKRWVSRESKCDFRGRENRSMKSNKIRVTPRGAQLFLPQLPPGAVVLGVVQRGLQIGALVRDKAGEYLQINGDTAQVLNKSAVEHALRAAMLSTPRAPARPVVGVRRRRLVER